MKIKLMISVIVCGFLGCWGHSQCVNNTLVANIAATNVVCNGNQDGSLDLTITGGVPPYTYSWSGGQDTEDLSNLPAGTYTVQVTDSNGCVINESATITEPSSALSVSITAVNANGTSGCIDAQMTANVTGGTAPYSFLWDDPLAQTSMTATNLGVCNQGGSIYNVVVTDANGCMQQQSAVVSCVTTCDHIIDVSTTNVVCKGDSTGLATANISSAIAPNQTYYIEWRDATNQVILSDSNVVTSTANNLTSGVYVVSVTVFSIGCNYCSTPVEQTVVITEPSNSIMASATTINQQETVNGNEGTVTVNATGGTAPYAYMWSANSNGSTTQTVNGLTPGNYCVIVADANGCESSIVCTTVDVFTCTSSPIVNAIPQDVLCHGDTSGTVFLSIGGGLPPYSYAWSGSGVSPNTPHQTALTEGVYGVAVTDSLGCTTAVNGILVNEPLPLSAGIMVTNVACNGGNNGGLDLTVAGGTLPYTFSWSNGPITEDQSVVGPGTYFATITDANGCMLASPSETVSQPTSALALSTQVIQHQQTVGGNEGEISSTVSGGTFPYTYFWYNSDTSYNNTIQDINQLFPGTYTLEVTDANGCMTSDTYTVDPVFCPTLNTASTSASCNPLDTGVFVSNLFNQIGCDSIHTLTVSLLQSDSTFASSASCNPMDTGVFVSNLFNQNSCDSVHTLTVSLLQSDSTFASSVSCNPMDTGVFVSNLFNQNSCDSVHTLTVSLLQSDSTFASSTSCNPTDTGVFISNLFNQNTCDSIHTQTVSLLPSDTVFAAADTFNTFTNVPISNSLGGNDVHTNGVFTLVQSPVNGTLALDVNGGVVYTPNMGFTGQDTWSYLLCDLCNCDTAEVIINVRNQVEVWPGDANNDGIADNNDVLVLGQHFGMQDLARPNPSVAWQADPAYAWLQNQAGGVNMAFVDCNGSGLIENTDAFVIDSNYNLIHSKTDHTKSGNTLLGLELHVDTLFAGDTAKLVLKLGTVTSPGQDLYGIAYSIDFDNSIVSDSYFDIDFTSSWLTPSANNISVFKPLHTHGQIDIGQSRINGNNESGHGIIATIAVVIEDDLHGKDKLVLSSAFNLRNVRLIDVQGDEEGVQRENLEIVVIGEDTVTTSVALLPELKFALFPNPFEEKIQINFEKESVYEISIFGMDAKILNQQFCEGNQCVLDLKELAQGIYWIKVSNEDTYSMQKVIKF